jgi:hypothetical protein
MIRDGGQAFPAFERWVEHRDGYDVERSGPLDGMTLRDYFAAQFMGSVGMGLRVDEVAKWAYKAADAMLDARRVE